MSSKFYIADTHFYHDNIRLLDYRPFASVEEMNAEMIRRWNDAVSPSDFVYIVGDMCWYKNDSWREIVPQLRGNKVLIRGNHDPHRIPADVRQLFAGVHDSLTVHDGDYSVFLCHYPVLFYPNSFRENTVHLCGHVHTTEENTMLEEFRTELRRRRPLHDGGGNRGRIINVGAMMPYMDYTPRTLEYILQATGL